MKPARRAALGSTPIATEEPAPQKSWRRIVGAGRLRMRPLGTDEQTCFGIVAPSAPAMQGHDG